MVTPVFFIINFSKRKTEQRKKMLNWQEFVLLVELVGHPLSASGRKRI